MILFDLQKAFDSVDHSILLMKLEASGHGRAMLRWFTSDLSNRQQLVKVSNCTIIIMLPYTEINLYINYLTKGTSTSHVWVTK